MILIAEAFQFHLLSPFLALAQKIQRFGYERISDAGSIILLSTLVTRECIAFLRSLLRQSTPVMETGRADRHRTLARPFAFVLVFGWALSSSFVPLQLDTLMDGPFAGLSRDATLALPVSAEMLCALLATLFAGWLGDQHGWRIPFVLGCVICGAGMVGSACASGPFVYIAARAVVGLGYGLAWMAIQAFGLVGCDRRVRTEAAATIVAGILAGQICGTITGAMLAEHVGFSAVLFFAALVSAGIALFAVMFMRVSSHLPRTHDADETPVVPVNAGLEILARDRRFTALLTLIIAPFSIVQVGLLQHVLPISLAEQGFRQSDIGRLMIVYGLSVILIAPLLGRWIDRQEDKKPFIVAGGLIGGAGLAFCWFDAGVAALLIAVFFLGLASSVGGPAQSSFALDLPSVGRSGAGRAMGVQRATDKLGQMIGPFAVGTLLASLGTPQGLAVLGLFYVCSTLLFLFVTHD